MSDEAKAILEAQDPFWKRASEWHLTEEKLDTLQLNIGLRCNLVCKHCHVEAGPTRTETMSRETMEHCLNVYRTRGFSVIDITGGAPEMNPNFEWLIRSSRELGARTMVRSNLVILHDQAYQHLPELFAELGIVLVTSLPHYSKRTAEKQRGEGSFDQIISMLQHLNKLGYGTGGQAADGTPLELDLVYNPNGAFLPPDQAALERDYKQQLKANFDISFDNLFALANNPLGRFGDRLYKTGNFERYLGKLIEAFNPGTLPNMMCRRQLSVRWDGKLYDCDFNQAADLPCRGIQNIAELDFCAETPLQRDIVFGNHCYACCAGAGSSCGGATA